MGAPRPLPTFSPLNGYIGWTFRTTQMEVAPSRQVHHRRRSTVRTLSLTIAFFIVSATLAVANPARLAVRHVTWQALPWILPYSVTAVLISWALHRSVGKRMELRKSRSGRAPRGTHAEPEVPA